LGRLGAWRWAVSAAVAVATGVIMPITERRVRVGATVFVVSLAPSPFHGLKITFNQWGSGAF